MDWTRGIWRKSPAAADEGRLVICGDWVPLREHAALAASDPATLYGDLLPRLRAADARVLNLETPLAEGGTPVLKDGPGFRTDPSLAAALAAVPFDAACLANNHVMDYGAPGLEQTLNALRAAGLRWVGAGANREEASRPLILEIRGSRVALINFSEAEDASGATDGTPGVCGFDIEDLILRVRAARSLAEGVIVIFHGGREYAPLPPPYVADALRRIAGAGVDAIVAHHPHVPQGVEVRDGVPIAYSTGNFVCLPRHDRLYARLGYAAEVALERGRVSGFELIPYFAEERGLRALEGDPRRLFLARLEAVSRPLAEPGGISDAWDALVDETGLEELLAPVRDAAAAAPGRRSFQARLRNRLAVPAHRELLVRGLTRNIEGRMGTAPGWARDLVREWGKLAVEGGKEKLGL
jgi:poly-gamma-glutamate synthesis protein (capsule biosynthesis protein)